jgi:hypothetical protein
MTQQPSGQTLRHKAFLATKANVREPIPSVCNDFSHPLRPRRSYRGVLCKPGCCWTNGMRALRVLLIILHSWDLSIHHFVISYWHKLMTAVVFLDSIGFEPRMWPYIRLIYAAHALQQTPHDKLLPTAETRSGERRPPCRQRRSGRKS